MGILVADDERDMARALEVMLERERYTVDAVHDGQEALDFALTGVYDCLVLDIMMPKLDGVEVLRTLRKQGVPTPVLLLTAKGEPDDRIFGLDAGADDYLPKPFVMGEFLARVRALTRRGAGFLPDRLEVGDLVLDRSTFALSCGEASVRLGNKEFQVLELLARRPGAFVPLERIKESVWGFDGPTEANVVWTYISYLRRKIEALGSAARIEGSRGHGYALEVGR